MKNHWMLAGFFGVGLLLSGCSEEADSGYDIEAEIKMDNQISKEDVIIRGTSSLPYETKLLVEISNNKGVKSEQIIKAGALGGFKTKDFLDQEPILKTGEYTVSVSSLPPSKQDEVTQETLGSKGENLIGDIVQEDANGERIAKVESKIAISVLDPTQPVTFKNGEYTVGKGKDILPGKYIIHTDEPEAGIGVSIFTKDGEEVFNEIMGTYLNPPLQYNDVEVTLTENDSITINSSNEFGAIFTPKK